MPLKTKKIILILYIAGNILLLTPLFLIPVNNIIFNNIRQLLIFHFNIQAIVILSLSVIIILFYDLYIYNNKKQFIKNNFIIENIFGIKNNIIFNLTLSLMGGFFEELFFRAYLFFLPLFIIKKITNSSNIYLEMFIVVIISIIFALLHINQGLEALLICFIFSFIFFISIKISRTIWYSVFFHSIFNFIEISFVYPLQRIKFKVY